MSVSFCFGLCPKIFLGPCMCLFAPFQKLKILFCLWLLFPRCKSFLSVFFASAFGILLFYTECDTKIFVIVQDLFDITARIQILLNNGPNINFDYFSMSGYLYSSGKYLSRILLCILLAVYLHRLSSVVTPSYYVVQIIHLFAFVRYGFYDVSVRISVGFCIIF